jgi:DnaJ-class molecular chaperone
MTKKIKCENCHGWGTLKGRWVKCNICHGKGKGCKTCKGKGKLLESCNSCSGAGWYRLKEKKASVYGSRR